MTEQFTKERKLDELKTKIEKMSKERHVEILSKLKNHSDVTLSANRYGVYINLTFLPQIVVDELQEYVTYIEEQETTLDEIEKQKSEMMGNVESS